MYSSASRPPADSDNTEDSLFQGKSYAIFGMYTFLESLPENIWEGQKHDTKVFLMKAKSYSACAAPALFLAVL